MTTDPLEILRQKRDELGTAELARQIGYSEATVRSICTGNYYGKPEKVLQAVMAAFVDVVICPHVDRPINRDDCHERAHGPEPSGGQSKKAWWMTCQTCPNKNTRI